MKKNTVLLDLDFYDGLMEDRAILDTFLNNTEKSFKIKSQFFEGQVYSSFMITKKVKGNEYYNTYYYIEADMIKELTKRVDELELERKYSLKRESDLNFEIFKLKRPPIVEIVKWWKLW